MEIFSSKATQIHFLDLCEQQFKDKPVLQNLLRQKQETLNDLRADFYEVLQNSWQACVDGVYSLTEAEAVSGISRHLAGLSRSIVDELYPHCGMQAANPVTDINRVWRDLHTISQHSLLLGMKN